MESPFERWRPPSLTAGFRGGRSEPPLERWEAVLHAERSAPYLLARAVSGARGLAKVLGVPAGLFAKRAAKLEDRERRAGVVGGTRPGRLARRLGRAEPRARLSRTTDGRPKPGPLLDREIDAALALLADVPFEDLQERGWNVQPNNWCWPLNDVPFLRRHPELWTRPRAPAGIGWDVEGQIEFIRSLGGYAHELADVPGGPEQQPGQFVWENGSFGAADAYAYYGLVRELRPKRVVEIGAGSSSLVLARALKANGDDARVTLIEPYPRWQVMGELSPGWELEQEILQKAPLKIFNDLAAGDVVFYDGSHCAETGGDVNWMLFRVLPRLPAGVWIHFHDVFWPYDYPAEWVMREGLTWNEQYMLQAFLMHNASYRVRLALAMLTVDASEPLRELFPPDRAFGASVWVQKDPGWKKRLARERRAAGQTD